MEDDFIDEDYLDEGENLCGKEDADDCAEEQAVQPQQADTYPRLSRDLYETLRAANGVEPFTYLCNTIQIFSGIGDQLPCSAVNTLQDFVDFILGFVSSQPEDARIRRDDESEITLKRLMRL
jgi:hypothetical protein